VIGQYFVDSWFLVALFDARDDHHRRAESVDRRLRNATLVTHDGVLTEFLAFVADEGPKVRDRAVRIVRDLMAQHVVVPFDRSLFLRALDRYEQRLDKEFSLVDCTSMVLMEERGIRHVLTNDHHFTQAGFIVVNE
jgi:uncharacterized protein